MIAVQNKPAVLEVPLYNVSENRNKIMERLEFLDSELLGTENEARYLETKSYLQQILDVLEYGRYPFIGVDDDGQIGAEWHDGKDYRIVSITPVNEEKVIINCIKTSFKSVVKIQTTLENIVRNSNKELMITI
ncbi:MAG: hypothetical protein LBP80_02935 [Treponema sp.]|jgi:hypothetical protein|nr:hypothetical protein [Treponema sp.]